MAPIALIAVVLACAAVSAQPLSYRFDLRGSEQIPANSSGATGSGFLHVNLASGAVVADGTFAGVATGVTSVGLYGPARRGAVGPQMLSFLVSGQQGGSFSATANFNVAQLSTFLEGLSYVELRSAAYPTGEMRGQVDVVPNSGTRAGLPPISLLGSATAGGTLDTHCGWLTPLFVLVGVPLPPGQSMPFPPGILCPLYPADLAFDLRFPFAVVPHGGVIRIPPGLTYGTVSLQCVSLWTCAFFSPGRRVAIRP